MTSRKQDQSGGIFTTTYEDREKNKDAIHVNPTLPLNERQEGVDINDETYPLTSFHLAPRTHPDQAKTSTTSLRSNSRRGPWSVSRDVSGVEACHSRLRL